jgi:hypothetical protein
MVLQIRQTRITVSHLHHFGKEYIVMPVHATRSIATLWVGINQLLSSLPEYVHGKFDDDNTLHITVAEDFSDVFDEVWSKIKTIPIDEMNIPVQKLEIHRKLISGGTWEKCAEYDIPK